MRILEIIEGLDAGGAQRFVVDLSNELSLKNEVALGTFIDRPNCNFYAKDIQANVIRLDYKLKSSRFLRIKQMVAVFRMIRKFKPQIVHLHDRAFIPCILPSLILHKINFYYTVHNIANKDAGNGYGSILRKIFLRRTISPVVISKYCGQTFKDYYGYSPSCLIENGCRQLHMSQEFNKAKEEINHYKKDDNCKVFINIARFHEQKNHELLIKSFNAVINEGHNIILLIVGSSPDPNRKTYLESLVTDKERIIFLGTKHNVQDYLSLSDYFCISSSWEGLPITILEAGLCGCYTISTPVGGVPDIIKSTEIGMLSRDLSVEAFRYAILEAMSIIPDKEKIKKYFEGRYTMAKCASRYLKAFSED